MNYFSTFGAGDLATGNTFKINDLPLYWTTVWTTGWPTVWTTGHRLGHRLGYRLGHRLDHRLAQPSGLLELLIKPC